MTNRLFLLTSALALLVGLAPATALSAKDIALLLTDIGAYPEAQHDTVRDGHETLADAYRSAGYRVYGRLSTDRTTTTELIASFESQIEQADKLVIHVNGQTGSVGDLALMIPSEVTPDDRTEAVLDGIPVSLLLSLAADKPTQSAVILGRIEATDLDPEIVDARFEPQVPQGVLLITGPSLGTGTVVLRDMLAQGKPATDLGTLPDGVTVSGLVSADFVLSDGITLRPPEPEPEPSPPTAEQIEADMQLTRAQRIQVQQDLTVLGYDTRGVDGVFGPGTRSALRAWQTASNRPVSGYLNPAQLEGLTRRGDERRATLAAQAAEREAQDDAWATARERDTVASYRRYLRTYPEGRYANRATTRIEEIEADSASAEEIRTYRRQEDALQLTVASVAVLEQRMRDLGYASGPADGQIDRRTRNGISAFQTDSGLTSTGYFNSATVQRLIITGDN